MMSLYSSKSRNSAAYCSACFRSISSGQAVLVRVELGQLVAVLAVVGPPAASRDHVDIQFGDDDLDPQLPQGVERLPELWDHVLAEFEVALHPVGIHRGPLLLQLRQQLDHLLALVRLVVVVVVVDEQRVGILGPRGLERRDDEVDAGGAGVDRIA